nr:MAG TPA: hypothetical protein [Bacteriophage sp.]
MLDGAYLCNTAIVGFLPWSGCIPTVLSAERCRFICLHRTDSNRG